MQWLEVAKIANTHGLKGELKLLASTDFPEERFKVGNDVFLETEGTYVPLTVSSYRKHKQFVMVTFKGMHHINDVEKYKGMKLFVQPEVLQELGENEYYYHEIIGCDVYDGDEKIGVVSEILETGANDVWTIKRPGKKDVLIPYIEQVVASIDVQEKRIQITPLPGLIEG
ncbi:MULTISPECIES: ribosome maturation factor RimM [Exiguobacterium]|uniref:Ribosome maturation factor RimM n=1 Tax=Exiguobacterium oxidotolerans TaxID=223958 RepID=A0A653IF47_9BACL|nr:MULTISPECIES: ribosome maturation factor RimM [Exiguobacterium]VWX37389.1 16S rRNA processing protein [Exiguobacterium oxidotolerans]